MIKQCLDCRLENLCYSLFFVFIFRVAIVSKTFEGKTDRTEHWYGTQYKQEAISDDVVQVC